MTTKNIGDVPPSECSIMTNLQCVLRFSEMSYALLEYIISQFKIFSFLCNECTSDPIQRQLIANFIAVHEWKHFIGRSHHVSLAWSMECNDDIITTTRTSRSHIRSIISQIEHHSSKKFHPSTPLCISTTYKVIVHYRSHGNNFPSPQVFWGLYHFLRGMHLWPTWSTANRLPTDLLCRHYHLVVWL